MRALRPGLGIAVLYEDQDLIVIDKPSGLLTVAAGAQRERTAYWALSEALRKRGEKRRVAVVHRLDRDTSGVLLFAKDGGTKRALMDHWNDAVKERRYIALAERASTGSRRDPTGRGTRRRAGSGAYGERPSAGNPDAPRGGASWRGGDPWQGGVSWRGGDPWREGSSPAGDDPFAADEGRIDAPLGEDRSGRIVVDPAGVPAATRWRVLQRGERYLLLELELETGRRNQIRAHLASRGCPVAGDRKYGAATDPIGRLALHAGTLSFVRPSDGTVLSFDSPVPKSFAQALARDSGLRQAAPDRPGRAATRKPEGRHPEPGASAAARHRPHPEPPDPRPSERAVASERRAAEEDVRSPRMDGREARRITTGTSPRAPGNGDRPGRRERRDRRS